VRDHYDIIGYPRLIRLNPNIPWKTRGNGALCLRVGKPAGKLKRKIGEIQEKEIFASLDVPKELTKHDVKHLHQLVKKIVEEQARVDDENTNPGFVLLPSQPSRLLYEKAVTQLVTLEETKHLLTSMGVVFEGYKNQRGLIGATAATAWTAAHDYTFELIAYREQARWGTPRDVESASVQHMDTTCVHTFDNYDYSHDHNRIVPNSPCPILYGIRGDNVDELITAHSLIRSEPKESWIIFESNQGTDDHLQHRHLAAIQPYDSVIAEGFVVDTPWTITGGHVFFTMKDATRSIMCAAYEPTKQFRKVIRELRPGDIVEVYGGVREEPLTINLEKINIKHLATQMEKIENPICPTCGKHMKSKGTNQGYECRICHTKNSAPVYHESARSISLGWYEVPVCARRHLSKPLKRMTVKPQQPIFVSTS